MLDPAVHLGCTEFYVVEKSVEVHLRRGTVPVTYRVEALRDLKTSAARCYNAKAYREISIFAEFEYYGPNGGKERESRGEIIWVQHPIQDVLMDTADAAITQAIGFL
jgi:hypothetical protein